MWKQFLNWLTVSGCLLIAVVVVTAVMAGSWLVGVTFLNGYQSLLGSKSPSKQDTGFISNFDESCPARARYGIEGFYYHGLAQIGITQSGDGNAILLARLRSPSIREFNNSYTLRGRTRRALTSSLVSRWYNLGEWY